MVAPFFPVLTPHVIFGNVLQALITIGSLVSTISVHIILDLISLILSQLHQLDGHVLLISMLPLFPFFRLLSYTVCQSNKTIKVWHNGIVLNRLRWLLMCPQKSGHKSSTLYSRNGKIRIECEGICIVCFKCGDSWVLVYTACVHQHPLHYLDVRLAAFIFFLASVQLSSLVKPTIPLLIFE